MNETELESMVVSLKGDGDSYQKMLEDSVKGTKDTASEIENHTSMIQGFGKAAAAALAVVAVAFAAMEIGSFLKDSFHEATEAEKGIIQLEAALSANGEEVAKVSKDYQEFAGELQKTIAITDDAVLNLLKTAQSFGVTGDAAKKAAQDAIYLGAATGQSAEAVVKFTSMMAKGDTKGAMRFARMIPQLRGIKDESELAARYQNLLAAGMETTEKQAGTVSGQIEILNNLWGDFKEMVGGVVGEALRPFVAVARYAVDWLGTLGDEIGAVKSFFVGLRERAEAAWEWLYPVRFALVSFFNFILEVGASLWEPIKSAATDVWTWVSELIGGSAGTIRDDLVWAILLAEYSFRNIDKIAEMVWTSIALGFVSFTEDFVFFFDTTVPELLNWFGEQFPNVFIDVLDSVQSMVEARFHNIATLFSNLMEVLQGKRNLSDIFGGLKDEFADVGFKFTELPKLSQRAMTDLEKTLAEDWARIADEFGDGFNEFYEKKMREMNSGGADFGEKDAYEIGMDLGDSLNEGMKSQIKQMDATLAGSAESLARIGEYRDMLARRNSLPNSVEGKAGMADDGGGRKAMTGGGGGAGGGGGPSAVEKLLADIKVILAAIKDRPQEMVVATNLEGGS